MSPLRRLLPPLLLAAACGAFAPAALAQDLASAEALFNDGRAELDKGNTETACLKVAESQRLDPSSGTLLNLAACHEKLGRAATAWGEFLAAARLAQSQGNPGRAEEAKRRAAGVQPHVSYLVVSVSAPPPGFTIRKDDVALEASAIGTRIPADPGVHPIEIGAPGFESVRLALTVKPDGDVQTLVLPPLRPSGAAPAKDATPGPAAQHAPNRVPALVVGGIGAAALLTGGVFGVLAGSKYREAKDACPTLTNCTAEAMSLHDSASTRATLANVGVGVGLAGLGVGVALWLLAGGEPEKAPPHAGLQVIPVVYAGQTGLAASVVFQ